MFYVLDGICQEIRGFARLPATKPMVLYQIGEKNIKVVAQNMRGAPGVRAPGEREEVGHDRG